MPFSTQILADKFQRMLRRRWQGNAVPHKLGWIATDRGVFNAIPFDPFLVLGMRGNTALVTIFH